MRKYRLLDPLTNNCQHQPLAQALIELEQGLLRALVPQLPGHYLLQLGSFLTPEWLYNPSTPFKRIVITATHESMEDEGDVQGDYYHLPFAEESMDVVVIPYVLEIESQPQMLLQEAWRVLNAGGHLLIMGLNPWSLLGLYKLLGHTKTLPIHTYKHLHSAARVCRWIEMLEGEIIQTKHFFFRPPVNQIKWLNKLYFLEKIGPYLFPNSGCAYLIQAKKQVIPLTPVKSLWQWQEILRNKPAEQPTTGAVPRGESRRNIY